MSTIIPNPVRRKLRPSTASARLQTHPNFSTSLDGNRPVTGKSSSTRPKTHVGGPRKINYDQECSPNDPQKQSRRLTVGAGGISDTDLILKNNGTHIPISELLREKIEEKISIDMLGELKKAFDTADEDGNGRLELEEFKRLFKTQLHITGSKDGQIDALFQKIDWSSEGAITWDEFCTYMQLEYAEKEDSFLRARQVGFHLPARLESIHHRENVLRITDTSDGMFIACSADGLVTFWSGSIEHKRTRTVITQEQSTRQKPKWITDFVLMPQYNKFIVGTGDREIQFFELSSFEAYCQISGLPTVPLKLDYCSTDTDECMILYGDNIGCINIIVISSAGECLRTWKKAAKSEGIASVNIDAISQGCNVRYIRWKVHNDWIQQLKYYPEIRQVISCCNNTDTALVMGCTTGSTDVNNLLKEIKEPGQKKVVPPASSIVPKGRRASDQTVFTVHKGVKCFDFSKAKNIIITGGMDRIIRIWDPYVSTKPTGILKGHNSPIFYLAVAEAENRIFSLSTDRGIHVWDLHDETMLLMVREKSHKIRGDLAAAHYSPVSKALCIATDMMCGLQLRLKPGIPTEIVISHKEPVLACVYNPNFKQVITCSEGSVIKLWDLETGSAIFEYGEAHGDSAITCLTFDSTGRRLITGGRDGVVRLWNYNNGHCLKTMKKEKGNEEICALQYIEMNKNRYIISVGWDKHVNIYADAPDESIKEVQPPQPRWPDDMGNGHKEDILSVAVCPSNLLATSGYDGQIIIWNMISGHKFCQLREPGLPNKEDDPYGDLSICKVVFLNTRLYGKDAASLVASGPRAHIHFWNVFQGGKLLSKFPGTREEGCSVTGMATNDKNSVLISSDSSGFLYVWDIESYCTEGGHEEGPPLLHTWRGHVESVTCVTMIQEHNMILTSSADCTARLWTLQGEYVGTFGQNEQWDIFNSSTFQHPRVPYDVLIDPGSLPNHPIMQNNYDADEIIHAESLQSLQTNREDNRPVSPAKYTRNVVYVDNDKIEERLKEKPYENATGKRLRHERKRPQKVGRANEYHSLKTYDLEPTPQPPPPNLKLNKDDPSDSLE